MRRLILPLALAVGFLFTGCAGLGGGDGGRPRHPFPQHSFNTLSVTPMMPSGMTRAQTDTVIVDLFREILRNDLIVDSAGPQTRNGFRMVFRHFQEEVAHGLLDVSHITTSESHGYGMLILAYMAGSEGSLGFTAADWKFGSTSLRDYFDAMLRTVLAFPSGSSVMFTGRLLGYGEADGENRGGYRVVNGMRTAPFTRDATAAHSSTNGDMDIIYALILADRQWGSSGRHDYLAVARRMLADLWRLCVHDDYRVMLLGDWAKSADNPRLRATVRTSDFKLGHLAAFRDADPAHDWQSVIDATLAAIRDIRTAQNALGNNNGLLPDFAVRRGAAWEVPAGNILGFHDDAFAFTAAFVPWRLGTAYILTGDRFLYEYVVRPLDDFARALTGETYLVRFGPVYMDGTPFEWVDPNWFAPSFAVTAAAVGADQRWVDAFWEYAPRHQWDFQGMGAYQGDTYGDYIRLIVLLTITGNYWAP